MAGLFYVPGISSGITWIRFWSSWFRSWSSYPPAAARARSAQGASQFAAGHDAARLASVTTSPQAAQPVNR